MLQQCAEKLAHSLPELLNFFMLVTVASEERGTNVVSSIFKSDDHSQLYAASGILKAMEGLIDDAVCNTPKDGHLREALHGSKGHRSRQKNLFYSVGWYNRAVKKGINLDAFF